MPKSRYIEVSVHTSAPIEVVWRVLYRSDRYAEWGPWATTAIERDGTLDRFGPGCIRSLRLGNRRIREEIVSCTPGSQIVYRLLSGIPVQDYIGTVTLERSGTGTTVHWSSVFRPTIWLTGALLEHMLATIVEAVASRLCEASQERFIRQRSELLAG